MARVAGARRGRAAPALALAAAASTLGMVLGAPGAVASVPGGPVDGAVGGAVGERCAGTEVTVVVDYGPLGGGAEVGCAEPGAGRSGADLVAAAGFEVTGVTGVAGFVCRVDGRPAPQDESCRRTPPGDAYWGLFTAERAGAPWVYATVGVASLEPAPGSLVGLRFQDGTEQVPPSVPRGAASGAGAAPSSRTASAPAATGATTAAEAGGGPVTVLVPVAAVAVGGLLVAVYLTARRRRAG